MGEIIMLLVIIYLVGIGVVLALAVQREWNSGTTSGLFGRIQLELLVAAAWPVTLYHRIMGGSAR